MIQYVESIRPELQVLLAPGWECLEQRHIYLVVPWSVHVVLYTAKKSDRCSLVGDRCSVQDRNTIWIDGADRVRSVCNCLSRNRVAEGARVDVVQLCMHLGRAGGEARIGLIGRTAAAVWVADDYSACAAIGRRADVRGYGEWDTGLRSPGQARCP